MGFREIFLERLAQKRRPVIKEIRVESLQAFTRKDLETAIQLYQHLKVMGNTFDDLVTFVEDQRRKELTANAKSAIQSTIFLTREQRRHLKKSGSRRRPA